MSYFGTNIKKIRQVKGLSQKAFADLFDLNRGVISAYEEHRAEPKIETLLKVAHYFNLDLDNFLTKPLQVNDLASSSNIDELMFSPPKANQNQTNDQKTTQENHPRMFNLQKKLAQVDLIYEFTEKTPLLLNYAIGDFLFLVKSNLNTENAETLLSLENGHLKNHSPILENNTLEEEFYKIVGHLSFSNKNILSSILERIQALEYNLNTLRKTK